MSVPVRDFLKRRRDRVVGTIMGHLERDVFKSLTQAQQEAARSVVLASVDSFYDTVLDLLKAEDGIRNDAVVEAIERLETRITGQARRASAAQASLPTS